MTMLSQAEEVVARKLNINTLYEGYCEAHGATVPAPTPKSSAPEEISLSHIEKLQTPEEILPLGIQLTQRLVTARAAGEGHEERVSGVVNLLTATKQKLVRMWHQGSVDGDTLKTFLAAEMIANARTVVAPDLALRLVENKKFKDIVM